eukprot:scaffold9996_cov86-Isochrysis_galbana.AAC.2
MPTCGLGLGLGGDGGTQSQPATPPQAARVRESTGRQGRSIALNDPWLRGHPRVRHWAGKQYLTQ